MKSLRASDLGFEEIIGTMETTIINHSERSSVPKRSQESYRKVRNNGREPRTDNVRESAIIYTCHNCKTPGHNKKHYKELLGKSGKPSNVESGTRNC